MSLCDLPDEILDGIFNLLESKSLYCCTFLNRKLHQFTKPLLWSSIHSTKPNDKKILTSIQDILQKYPHYSDYVKEFSYSARISRSRDSYHAEELCFTSLFLPFLTVQVPSFKNLRSFRLDIKVSPRPYHPETGTAVPTRKRNVNFDTHSIENFSLQLGQAYSTILLQLPRLERAVLPLLQLHSFDAVFQNLNPEDHNIAIQELILPKLDFVQPFPMDPFNPTNGIPFLQSLLRLCTSLKKLDISFRYLTPLPHECFTSILLCKTLTHLALRTLSPSHIVPNLYSNSITTLELDGIHDLEDGIFVSFPNLKHLRLSFKWGNSLNRHYPNLLMTLEKLESFGLSFTSSSPGNSNIRHNVSNIANAVAKSDILKQVAVSGSGSDVDIFLQQLSGHKSLESIAISSAGVSEEKLENFLLKSPVLSQTFLTETHQIDTLILETILGIPRTLTVGIAYSKTLAELKELTTTKENPLLNVILLYQSVEDLEEYRSSQLHTMFTAVGKLSFRKIDEIDPFHVLN